MRSSMALVTVTATALALAACGPVGATASEETSSSTSTGTGDEECPELVLELEENEWVAVRSAAAAAEFPRYTRIVGDFGVGGEFEGVSDLDSVAFLECLREVTGRFSLHDTQALTSLDGLERLEHVGGALKIERNEGLVSLEGLSSLQTIDGNVLILRNPALQVVGLRALEEVGGYFWLGFCLPPAFPDQAADGNPALTEIDGLDSLTSCGLIIAGNKQLSDISSLSSLDERWGGESYVDIQVNESLDIAHIQSVWAQMGPGAPNLRTCGNLNEEESCACPPSDL